MKKTVRPYEMEMIRAAEIAAADNISFNADAIKEFKRPAYHYISHGAAVSLLNGITGPVISGQKEER